MKGGASGNWPGHSRGGALDTPCRAGEFDQTAEWKWEPTRRRWESVRPRNGLSAPSATSGGQTPKSWHTFALTGRTGLFSEAHDVAKPLPLTAPAARPVVGGRSNWPSPMSARSLTRQRKGVIGIHRAGLRVFKALHGGPGRQPWDVHEPMSFRTADLGNHIGNRGVRDDERSRLWHLRTPTDCRCQAETSYATLLGVSAGSGETST